MPNSHRRMYDITVSKSDVVKEYTVEHNIDSTEYVAMVVYGDDLVPCAMTYGKDELTVLLPQYAPAGTYHVVLAW